MFLLLPIILIILILYIANAFYYEDTKPKNNPEKKVIHKEHNVSAQSYLDKYLKKE